MNKKKKKEMIDYIVKINLSEEMKEDSIAHLVKQYFTYGTARCAELFDCQNGNGKILVSKKALNHILKICDCELLEDDYDFEFVEQISIKKTDEE